MYEKTEELLKKYFKGQLHQDIKTRRLEIAFPPSNEADLGVKVQTSKKGESPQESLYEKMESDRFIALTERRIGIIENFLKHEKEIKQGVGFDVLYLYDYKGMNYQQIEMELKFSSSTLHRIRKERIEELSDLLTPVLECWEKMGQDRETQPF